MQVCDIYILAETVDRVLRIRDALVGDSPVRSVQSESPRRISTSVTHKGLRGGIARAQTNMRGECRDACSVLPLLFESLTRVCITTGGRCTSHEPGAWRRSEAMRHVPVPCSQDACQQREGKRYIPFCRRWWVDASLSLSSSPAPTLQLPLSLPLALPPPTLTLCKVRLTCNATILGCGAAC